MQTEFQQMWSRRGLESVGQPAVPRCESSETHMEKTGRSHPSRLCQLNPDLSPPCSKGREMLFNAGLMSQGSPPSETVCNLMSECQPMYFSNPSSVHIIHILPQLSNIFHQYSDNFYFQFIEFIDVYFYLSLLKQPKKKKKASRHYIYWIVNSCMS